MLRSALIHGKNFRKHDKVAKMHRIDLPNFDREPPPRSDIMSIVKQYLKTKPACKVTFTLSAEQSQGARQVAVVGEFNAWDQQAHLMKKQKNGDFSLTLTLPVASQYQFRYLLDEQHWCNDEAADSYVPSPISYDHNALLQL